METKAYDIAMVGLGVMGQNLARNMARQGWHVAAYNRKEDMPAGFAAVAEAEGIGVTEDLAVLAASLRRPRRLMLMVRAGGPVDAVLEGLLPYLEPGDVVIDGGNSFYQDTIRREQALARRGVSFLGVGVSGGEEGALWGPSLMAGGSREGWESAAPILRSIAARAEGEPCCGWVGPGGAGHFVKAVHNGIEYGDMQLICEAYWVLRQAGMEEDAIARVMEEWNRGALDSYLMEITAAILRRKDPETGLPLVRVILDTAEQKGTGMWTSREALQMGVPAPTVAEAVFARCLSAAKTERQAASRTLAGPGWKGGPDPMERVEALRQALYASKICAYAQGFALLREASHQYGWKLRPGEIAMLWRGGCIIRARFLREIKAAYDENPDLENLMLAPAFAQALEQAQEGWRQSVAQGILDGVPMPCMASALAYYDGYRSETLPAHLLQAQRDCFGAHTYRRVDREGSFHTAWGL